MGHSQVQYHPVLGGKCQKCEGSGRLTAPCSLLSPLDWQMPAKDPATRKNAAAIAGAPAARSSSAGSATAAQNTTTADRRSPQEPDKLRGPGQPVELWGAMGVQPQDIRQSGSSAAWPPWSCRKLSYRCATITAMAVRKKRSISLPPELDAEIAAAAEQAGVTYSAWLAATARKEFTIRAGLAAVAQFEEEHGAFSPDELADADRWAAEAVERASAADQRQRSA